MKKPLSSLDLNLLLCLQLLTQELSVTRTAKRMNVSPSAVSKSLAKLRGPIGLYIGSKTPAEIAVSVMAEILAVKNAVPLPQAMSVEVAKHEHDIAMNEASTHCAIAQILQPGSAH